MTGKPEAPLAVALNGLLYSWRSEAAVPVHADRSAAVASPSAHVSVHAEHEPVSMEPAEELPAPVSYVIRAVPDQGSEAGPMKPAPGMDAIDGECGNGAGAHRATVAAETQSDLVPAPDAKGEGSFYNDEAPEQGPVASEGASLSEAGSMPIKDLAVPETKNRESQSGSVPMSETRTGELEKNGFSGAAETFGMLTDDVSCGAKGAPSSWDRSAGPSVVVASVSDGRVASGEAVRVTGIVRLGGKHLGVEGRDIATVDASVSWGRHAGERPAEASVDASQPEAESTVQDRGPGDIVALSSSDSASAETQAEVSQPSLSSDDREGGKMHGIEAGLSTEGPDGMEEEVRATARTGSTRTCKRTEVPLMSAGALFCVRNDSFGCAET